MNIPKFWKSSLGFSFFTFVSRIFGYLRDLVLSSNLGASAIHDIFVVIFRIPNVFRSFFGEGALSQSLVPSIIEANQHQTRFLNQVFTLLVCVLVLFILFVELFPAFFVTLFAPGYLADLDTLNNSTNFLRLIFPYILLISLVAFFGAIQNSKKYFQVVAATPIIFNITLILFALSFSNLTLGVIGASILIAGALQLMLNVLYTAKLGYLPAFDFSFDASLLQTFFNRLLFLFFNLLIFYLFYGCKDVLLRHTLSFHSSHDFSHNTVHDFLFLFRIYHVGYRIEGYLNRHDQISIWLYCVKDVRLFVKKYLKKIQFGLLTLAVSSITLEILF